MYTLYMQHYLHENSSVLKCKKIFIEHKVQKKIAHDDEYY